MHERQENLIYGIQPVLEALLSGKTFDKLFVKKGLKGAAWSELRQELKTRKVSYFAVPTEKLNRLTRKNHQGVVGFISPIEFHDLAHLVQDSFEQGITPFFLLLDRVTDVRNFGAIVRSAQCAGVNAIVVPNKGSAPVNADAIKTSAGALLNLPICKEPSLKRAVSFLQSSGFKTVACTEKATQPIYKMALTGPVAIVMGNEEKGISEEVLAATDEQANIPMPGEMDSLNVSVAAGIVLFEVVRQRYIL